MWPKKHCCICPIPFHGLEPQNAAMCLLKLWFFMNQLSQGLATSAIGFGMPQTLNMHHSSNFNAFYPVKINKMWNFCLKLWFFLEPLITETQNLQYWIWHASNLNPLNMCPFPDSSNFKGKSVHKDLHFSQSNNFVWTKWFFCIYYGKVKILGSETLCRGKMWPKEDCCICPIPFSWIWTPFAAMCLLKLWHEPLIVGTCNKCHWIWHASNPKYAPLKQFQCIVPSQTQQNVKFLSGTVCTD